MEHVEPSAFRVEKHRSDAIVTLTSGTSVIGHVFLAKASPTLPGQERVIELLNSESGFFPFEDQHGQTVLYNRDHVVCVELSDDEASRDSGYGVATARTVSVLLSNGMHVQGTVRVYRPEGRDRLSDWARHNQRFRYIETARATFIINADHIVSAKEASE
jgi:hypothetical protein